jgi:hypothetical protein
MARAARPHRRTQTLHVAMRAAAARSELYQRDAVRAERQCDDGSWDLVVELESADIARYAGVPGVHLERNRADQRTRGARRRTGAAPARREPV